MDVPKVPSGFLTVLQQAFPDKLPRKEVSPFEQGRLLGQQEVIDKLTTLHDKEYRAHVHAQDT